MTRATTRMTETTETTTKMMMEDGSETTREVVGKTVDGTTNAAEGARGGRDEDGEPTTTTTGRGTYGRSVYDPGSVETAFCATVNPARALTVGLTATYESINRNYYDRIEVRRRLSHEEAHEDDEDEDDGGTGRRESGNSTTTEAWSHQRRSSTNPRELVKDRYILDKVLGRGSFGKVVLAYDMAEDKHVAIKVIERSPQADTAVKQEVEFLKELNAMSPVERANGVAGTSSEALGGRGRDSCVRLIHVFEHEIGAAESSSGATNKKNAGYQCLVFELMSHSLYDLLRVTNLGGVSVKLVRKFSVQILRALEYIASRGIIHCDMKPENVLLCHSERSAVKIIDFGSACKVGKQQFSYVQSRFYRAPEVMLGLHYGTAIDMWSAGCMLYELRTGKPLFTGWSEHDQLFRIQTSLGKVPQSVYDKIPEAYKIRYFDSHGLIKPSPEALRASRSMNEPLPEPGSRPLGMVLLDELTQSQSAVDSRKGNDQETSDSDKEHKRKTQAAASVSDNGKFDEEHEILLALLSRMIVFEPSQRITATEALAHPFFFPINGKKVFPQNAMKKFSEKRLPSIPNMDDVEEMNAREAVGGIGERFTFTSK